MKHLILVAAFSALSTLSGCQAAEGFGPYNLASLSGGTISGFDEAKFKTLVASSGRDFGSQSACLAHLDQALADLLVAPDGTLFVDVKDVRLEPGVRRFSYAGHFNYCGAPPPADQPDYTCKVPAPDTFTCSDGTLRYQPAPVPPAAAPQRTSSD